MVEAGFRPVALIVAVGAFLTVGAVMNVIKCMTAITGNRCPGITFIDVTGITGGIRVLALQAEISFIMVELDLVP